MYQGIYYDYFTRKAYVRDDEEGIVSFEYQPVYYKIDEEGEFDTLDGRKCTATTVYNKHDKDLLEKDVDKNLSILLELYKDDDSVPKWHRRVFFDIETQMGFGAINNEYCKQCPAKITAIALYDEFKKEYFVYILDENSKITDSSFTDTIVVSCKTETELLQKFINKFREIDPTLLVGYNSSSFDVPYLYHRLKKKLGVKEANKLSPIGIVNVEEYDTDEPVKIALLEHLDFLRIYKKFIPKNQPSYSLENISQTELGKGKLQYEGNLDDLFKNDIELYLNYNKNDVALIVELEEKKKFLELAVTVCHFGKVPYHYVYHSSRLLEGVIMSSLKKQNIISPNKPTTDDLELKNSLKDDGKFAGAYVMDAVPGLYGWNFDEDIISLYPTILEILNASKETLLFRIIKSDPFDTSWSLAQMKEKDPNLIVEIENINSIYKEIKLKKLIKFIESNNVIISPNGVGFSSEKTGFLCIVIRDWFNKRKHYKDLMKASGKAGDKKMYNFYNSLQSIYKILLNSIYGCMGLKSFRYSCGKDIIAEAVTVSGRFIIIESGKFVNNKINSEIGNF